MKIFRTSNTSAGQHALRPFVLIWWKIISSYFFSRHFAQFIIGMGLNPSGIYFKVNNGNIRTNEICSKLTIKTPDRRQWRRSGVFVNFKLNSHIVLFPLLTVNKYMQVEKGLIGTKLCTSLVAFVEKWNIRRH